MRHNKAHPLPSSLSLSLRITPLASLSDLSQAPATTLQRELKVNVIQRPIDSYHGILNGGSDSLLNTGANAAPQSMEDAIASERH